MQCLERGTYKNIFLKSEMYFPWRHKDFNVMLYYCKVCQVKLTVANVHQNFKLYKSFM